MNFTSILKSVHLDNLSDVFIKVESFHTHSKANCSSSR